jgi:hypothetical protein
MQTSAYEPSHLQTEPMGVDPELAVDARDLVGAAEIAEKLGFKHPQSIHTLRRRHAGFPAPVARLKRAYIWSWALVERWARETGRII